MKTFFRTMEDIVIYVLKTGIFTPANGIILPTIVAVSIDGSRRSSNKIKDVKWSQF